MTTVLTPAEFTARHKAYRRERAIVAFFGYSPLIALYLLTHSGWLKQQLPQSKELAVLYLVVLPIVWFASLMWLHGRFAPRWHRLRCPKCAHALVADDYRRTMDRGACPACGATVVAPAAVSN